MAKWYKEYLVSDRPHHDGAWGGRQRIYKFPNGYGASVIPEYVENEIDEHEEHQNPEFDIRSTMKVKKGFWEIGVFYNDELTHDTPITDDVLRQQTDPDVDNILGQIKRL